MPVIINQINLEVPEPAPVVDSDAAVVPPTGQAETADRLREQLDLLNDRQQRLQVD